MSVDRAELHRLVDQLPEQQVADALAELQRWAEPDGATWPPPFFSSFASGRGDLSTNHDDLLAEGFGRD